MRLNSYPRVYFELTFMGFTLVMGMSLSSAFLPIFANELDSSGTLVGLTVSAWFLSRVFIELPSGILSDRFGRRKLLVGGLILAAAGIFTCSLANSIYFLIIGRALWGLGAALFFMSSTMVVLDLFEPRVRGRALGTFQGIEFIGSFIGAPIGGFMAIIMGYRGVFSLALLLTLCSFSVAFASKGLRQKVSKMGEEPRFSVKNVFSTFRNWNLAIICVNSFSRLFVVQGVIGTILPLFLNRQLGIHVELIGVILSLRILGHIIATVTSGHLSDKFGRKPMIMIGILIQICCWYLYTLVSSFELLLLVGLFDGVGLGMSFTPLIVLLSETVPAEFRGGAIGMYRTFMDVGGSLGPLFFMFIFDGPGPYIAFLSAIAVYAVNFVLMMTVKGKKTTEQVESNH